VKDFLVFAALFKAAGHSDGLPSIKMGPVPGHNCAFRLVEKVHVRRIATKTLMPVVNGFNHPGHFESESFNCFLIKNDFIKKSLR
jgi:hypothetical protein